MRHTRIQLRKQCEIIIASWKHEWIDTSFRFRWIALPPLFLLYSYVTRDLAHYIENRRGIQLKDSLLHFFPGYDFSVLVFTLLYTSIFLFILSHLSQPRIILKMLEMHFWVALIRQLCILYLPLEPPAGIIMLRDVFLENTIYPHAPLTKDLFFSGHAASIWIYFLCAQRKFLRVYLFFALFCMSFMLLSMRVHYSYDIYGAVIITTIIYFSPNLIMYCFLRLKNMYHDIVY